MGIYIDLPPMAQLDKDLKDNRRAAITDENALDVQALCVAEEAGELVGAYRRWAGKARRAGSLNEVAKEIADVIIVAALFAEMLGINVDDALAIKLTEIYKRGWKEN